MANRAAAYNKLTYAVLQTRLLSDLAKRLFDILASLTGLLLLIPLFLWVAHRIKRDSPGPVFYRGPRVGRGGRLFRILKFRTMREDPTSYAGPRVTAKDDPRITPLGHWLRDTKLNELPQLWNVLIGDMSLVGPRPEDPELALKWTPDVRDEVTSVRPGITSPASVLFRNEEAMLSSRGLMQTYLDSILPTKLRLDQLYVRHRSFWLDLDTILWTALVLLPKLSTYEPPERDIFSGPVYRLMRRYVSWFLVDLFVSFVSLTIAGSFWRTLGPLDVGVLPGLGLAAGFAMLFSLSGALLGANRIQWSRAPASEVLTLLPGAALAGLLALLADYYWPFPTTNAGLPLLPPALLLTASVLAFSASVAIRYRTRLVSGFATRWVHLGGQARTALERVLIVGGGETAQLAAWLFAQSRRASIMRVVGCVDDDLMKQGARIHGMEVLGQSSDIPHLVEKHDIGIIVFAIHNISPTGRKELMNICSRTSARLVLMPDLGLTLNSIALNVDRLPLNVRSHGHLPCDVCLTRTSPLKVEQWLIDLQETAEDGDLEAVRSKIGAIRGLIRPDVLDQLEANLGG